VALQNNRTLLELAGVKMETYGYIASLVMGIVLGLMGGGGSILTVPIMVYLFGLPPTVATGYSLFVVGTAALIGASLYLKTGDIDFKTGLLFAIPSIVGVTVSRGYILPRIPQTLSFFDGLTVTKEILVMTTFALLMIAASYSMIKKNKDRTQKKMSPLWSGTIIVLEGLAVGAIAGFVGAGGGFLIIPALVILIGLPMRTAIGTSLMIIALQSLIGFAGDISRGAGIDWRLLLIVTATAIIGIVGGSAVSHKIKERQLKTAFGWFVLFMGAAILLEQTQHLS
jgi:uncharacterized membrane protein YfcA